MQGQRLTVRVLVQVRLRCRVLWLLWWRLRGLWITGEGWKVRALLLLERVVLALMLLLLPLVPVRQRPRVLLLLSFQRVACG